MLGLRRIPNSMGEIPEGFLVVCPNLIGKEEESAASKVTGEDVVQ